jgi:hypothetical protein
LNVHLELRRCRRLIREWAYAGITFDVLAAIVAYRMSSWIGRNLRIARYQPTICMRHLFGGSHPRRPLDAFL